MDECEIRLEDGRMRWWIEGWDGRLMGRWIDELKDW